MDEPSAFRKMLDELRFDEAETLIANTGDDPDLLEEVRRRRDEAEDRARILANRIIQLGNDQDHEELLRLADDTMSRPLLALAPEASRQRAELHLRQAKRWEDNRRETNTRRLAEARRALDGLDLELARGLMRRIDGRFLTSEQEEVRDRLLLDISGRAMELEALAETGRRLVEETEPRGRKRRGRPWWRRWLGGAGPGRRTVE